LEFLRQGLGSPLCVDIPECGNSCPLVQWFKAYLETNSMERNVAPLHCPSWEPVSGCSLLQVSNYAFSWCTPGVRTAPRGCSSRCRRHSYSSLGWWCTAGRQAGMWKDQILYSDVLEVLKVFGSQAIIIVDGPPCNKLNFLQFIAKNSIKISSNRVFSLLYKNNYLLPHDI
jgi:hypothetical protein